MKWLLVFLLFSVSAFAQAPVDAPGSKYFMGPSLGEVWQRTGAISGGINSQTGTTYTVACSDNGKTIFFNNASAIAVTLPQANANTLQCFGPYWQTRLFNIGAGTVTVTPTTSTINGSSTKTYATNAGGTIQSDGTNYWSAN